MKIDICIFSCLKVTKWVQHGADKVFFIIIDSQYNLILFANIRVLWILMKFSPAPRSSSSQQPGLIRKKWSWRVVFCVPRNVPGLVTARTQPQSWITNYPCLITADLSWRQQLEFLNLIIDTVMNKHYSGKVELPWTLSKFINILWIIAQWGF